MHEILQTPDSQFENLEGFPYQPNYIEINGYRIHYIDEGKGDVILCIHGEPTWSYLYRKFIPILSKNYRVIAPDFIGCGRSDKPTKVSDYTFKLHLDTLLGFIDKMKIDNITIVVQDWGGLLGLSAVGKIPEKFARLIILNTFLPIGKPLPFAFKLWQAFSKYYPGMPVDTIIQKMTTTKLSKEVLRAYNAPFPSNKFKAGVKAFPGMVPSKPEMAGVPEMKHAREVLSEWKKPALVMFSDKDPVFSKSAGFFRKLIPAALDQPEITIKNASHFLQEDKGEEIAEHILSFVERTK